MRLSELAYEMITPDPQIDGLTADSRAVSRGFLFAALPGVNVDGAKFIAEAEEKGAAAILARPGVTSKLPVITDEEPRRRLAQMAARFYPRQPDIIAGVTGTNGKTSTARFAAQLWSALGHEAGSMGTLGAQSRLYERPLAHTTPDPVMLHETLDALARGGVTHLAMEVSSHALVQFRADAVNFTVAAFTNITQDHLDYHASFEDYFSAKGRLFRELLAKHGVAAVNMDGAGAEGIVDIARERKVATEQTGVKGRDGRLVTCATHLGGLALEIECRGHVYRADTRLIGAFQAENALLAAGMVIAAGGRADEVMAGLQNLEGAPGRMEFIT